MDNDLDSMRDLWRQFRRMLVKKVGCFDLFREAALHELTPDWFQARYGSVWQHAFVLIKNLWLFLEKLKGFRHHFAPNIASGSLSHSYHPLLFWTPTMTRFVSGETAIV